MAGHRAVESAVETIVAIVAENEIRIFAAGDFRVLNFFGRKGFNTHGQIRLGQFLAVHEEMTVLEIDRFTRKRDDALHAIGAIGGIFEHDDFATALQLTFEEDRDIVEEQQRRLTEFGENWLVDIVSDATRLQMRRIFNDLLTDERKLAAE